MKQYLLFDLDGTLTDPREGITSCVQYALKDAGIDEPDTDRLLPFIGPPLKDSFRQYYHMNEEQIQRAIEKYRERFQDQGIFENELYGGIHDLLRTLKGNGMHLAVASNKPTVYVERILKHFKLDKYFEVVVGSELDGTRGAKSEVILEVLHQFFGEKPIRYDEVYMIGDRRFDIEGARTFHIESVGVTYGYGSMEELKEAKADYIVKSVPELKRFLMREVEEASRIAGAQKPGQGEGARKPKGGTAMVLRLLIPFLMFILAKKAATNMGLMLLNVLATKISALFDFIMVKDEAGEVIAFTGNASVIAETIGYAVAVLFIWKYARSAISKTAEEMKLSHLKKEPAVHYVYLAMLSVGAVLGLNLFLDLIGLVDNSATYQAVSELQYSANFVFGLLSYSLITPVCEELLFRGVIYNNMKRVMKKNMALLLSAFIFGFYHGNSVQGMYAFAIGLIMAYAYEYFGSFYMAVAVHMVANLVAYTLSFTGITSTAFVSWPVCIIFFVMCGAGAFLLRRKKKVYDWDGQLFEKK